MRTSGRIKVLHVISGLGIGGAERLLLWAARYHDRERYPLGILSLMSGGELAPDIRKTGVPLMELGQRRGRLSPGGFLRFIGELRRYKPEIIQAHMFHSNILTRFTRPLGAGGSLLINTIHNEWEARYRHMLDAATAGFASGFITFSPRGEEAFTQPGPAGRPVCHVPYGIEIPAGFKGDRAVLRARLELPVDRYIWIAIGRLTRQKAFGDLIEAFSIVCRGKKPPILILAGDGEDRRFLEETVREKGLFKSVHFLGLRSDIHDLLTASDAFVLSSHWEGNPLVVLEAMAASLPVVATRVGMIHTMTADGETAVLVEPKKPQSLAEAMLRVMNMEDGGRSMGKTGRLRLERYYDFRRMQREVEKFYDYLMDSGRKCRYRGGER